MIRKKLMTVAMAAMFAASSLAMPVAAMAEETTPTEEVTEQDGGSEDDYDDDDFPDYETNPAVKASNETVTHDGDITLKGDGNDVGVEASDSSKVTVNGNIKSESNEGFESGINTVDSSVTVNGSVNVNGPAVDATGSSVKIQGDVSSTRESGISARNGSDVSVNGSVTAGGDYYTSAVSETGGSSVTIGKDVVASGDHASGISSDYNTDKDKPGEVTVGGNVKTTGTDSIAINLNENAKNVVVTINGNVESKGDGIYSGNSRSTDPSTVIVKGNLTASDHGINVNPESNDILVIEGTLRGDKAAIYFNSHRSDPEPEEETEEGITSTTIYFDEDGNIVNNPNPSIYVTSLETGNGGSLIAKDENMSNSHLRDVISAAVRYIIHADNIITNGQTVTVNDRVYTVAKAGDTVNLKPNVPSGYRLTGWDFGAYQASVRDNGDGTYSVVVAEGGNLVFKANIEKIAETNSTNNAVNDNMDKTKDTTVVNTDNNNDKSTKTSAASTTKSSATKTSTTSGKSSSSTSSGSNSSSSGKTTSPKTGDNANTATWVVVFAAALVGIGASLRGARKNHR